ncbi:MAG: LacI family transcriptional regulator [Candidatus Pacebacteria bacterium]|nr:LacI family transcriptional regulator [Candidatus Paceibacterota bacterium]
MVSWQLFKDIARKAGVSVGTVSGVLNGARNFSEETRRRVLDTAAELKYTPNLMARSIRRNPGFTGRPRTNIIGYVTREGNAAATDTFTSKRLLLLAHVAAAKGYHILPLLYDRATAFSCAPVQNGYVDGVLAGLPDADIARAVSHLTPLVLMDVPFDPQFLPAVSRVNFDIYNGMCMLVQDLKELGHRKAATLTIDQAPPLNYDAARCPILEKACCDLDLRLHPDLSRPRALSVETHEQVMDDYAAEAIPLIKRGEITALILVGDGYADSIVRRLLSAGVRVPDDVSVCGFGSTALSGRQTCLPLTTIEYPWRAMLDAAIELVVAEIEGRDHRQGEILIRTEFVRGASTAACPVSNLVPA